MKRFVVRPFLFLTTAVLIAGCAVFQQTTNSDDWITLFDGSGFEGWTMAGPGEFILEPDGSMLGTGGMGLFYYSARSFRDFELELEWKAVSDSANSGIFVRFPEQTDDPWYAVNNGYEIQIYDKGDAQHSTGAIYSFANRFKPASRPAGEWNTYLIRVTGQRYEIFLNGEQVNDFFGDRGREGYIGLQNHDDVSKVWYRNVRVRPLDMPNAPESLAEHFAQANTVDPIRVLMVTTTHGFRHGPAIDAAKKLMTDLSATTEFDVDITEDVSLINAENLANYDLLFFANTTLRVRRDPEETSSQNLGTFGNWDLTLATPQGDLGGFLTLSGDINDLSGTVVFYAEPNAQPSPLLEPTFEGNQLTFTFDAGNFGILPITATIDGDNLSGSLDFNGAPLPLTGLNTGELARPTGPEILFTEAQMQAVMDFMAAGKGFVGAHAATDTFYGWAEYREMVGGGLFDSHPWTTSVRINIEEPDNAAVTHFGDHFWLVDEIYVLDENPRWNSRVLASLDMETAGAQENTAGPYRNDYPISWIRKHNGGNVFYTKLGHFPDVWNTPFFVEHLLQGMRIAAGRIDAEFGGRRVKETIAENVWPDDIAVDDRGNVWIAELRGKVHRYDAETEQTTQIGFIETTDPTNIEHGLFGIEVDPNFYEDEPWVYLYYTERETVINTLVRMQYRNGALDPSTTEVLLRVPTEPQCCHQAGDLEWGPDGTLYVSTGDTGMSETRPEWEVPQEDLDAFFEKHGLTEYQWSRLVDSERSAQNLQDLRGKILRINKDGTIPKDNPFFGQPGIRWEIYAYGLRNPYRFKVDPQTGYLYIGVVGPDEVTTYDEYNISMQGGENFGWPRDNGRLVYNEWDPSDIPDFAPSFWEYTYETGGRSASGGPIYRHTGERGFPPVFEDKAFTYDWSRRWIKYGDIVPGTVTMEKTNGETFTFETLRMTNIKTFDILMQTQPISMELGPDGCLYVAEFTGFWDAAPGSNVSRYCWED